MVKTCRICGHEALPEHMKQYHPILAEYNNVGAYETSRRQELQAQIKKTINFINVASFENPMNMGPENEKLEALKNELASLGESKASENLEDIEVSSADWYIEGSDIHCRQCDQTYYVGESPRSDIGNTENMAMHHTQEHEANESIEYNGDNQEDVDVAQKNSTRMKNELDKTEGDTDELNIHQGFDYQERGESKAIAKEGGDTCPNCGSTDVNKEDLGYDKDGEFPHLAGTLNQCNNCGKKFDGESRKAKEATDLFDDDEAEDHDDKDETDNLFESVAKEFNIGTDMTCPICHKEIDVGNTGEDTQGLDYNNVNVAWDRAGTYPEGWRMQDHFEQEHKASDFGLQDHWSVKNNEAWEDWQTGNQLHQAFHDSFPSFDQNDVHLMNMDTGRAQGVNTYNSQGDKRFDNQGNTPCPNCGADELFDKSGHGNWGKSVYCQSCGWEGNVDDTKYGESKANEDIYDGGGDPEYSSGQIKAPRDILEEWNVSINYDASQSTFYNWQTYGRNKGLTEQEIDSEWDDWGLETVSPPVRGGSGLTDEQTRDIGYDFRDAELRDKYSHYGEGYKEDLQKELEDAEGTLDQYDDPDEYSNHTDYIQGLKDSIAKSSESHNGHEYTCGICGDKFGDEAEYTDHKIAHDMDGTQ